MKGSVVMKKGFIISAIGLWTVVVIAIIFFAINISQGRVSQMTISSESLLKNEEVSLGNTENITIETTRQSIHILKTDGDKIKVSQYGSLDINDEELFQVSTSSDGIHIYIKKDIQLRVFNFFGVYDERLVVEIPEYFIGNLDLAASSGSIKVLDEFTLKDASFLTTSGSTRIPNNITADNLSISSSSGSIKLGGYVTANDLSAKATSGSIRSSMDIKVDGNINLNTSSGSIHVDKDITAKEIYVGTSSGGIRLENVNVEEYDLESSSGSIKVNSISGGGSAKASSGGIHLALANPNGDIYINTTSGSIKVALESSLQFNLTAQTASGGIRTNFATQKNERGNQAIANIGDNPTVSITAKASSGGIRIEN